MKRARFASNRCLMFLAAALLAGIEPAAAQRPIQRPGQIILVPESPGIGSGPKNTSPRAEALRAQGAEVDLDRVVPTVIWTDERLTDDQLPLLKEVVQLEKLVVRDRPITDDGLLAIKDLQHLWVLNLSNTKVTDGVMKSIQNLVRLKRLYLGGTAVTDELLTPLSEMSELEYVELPPQISDGAIESFREVRPLARVVREAQLKPGSPQAVEARAKALRDQGLFAPAIALYRPIAETAFKKSPEKPHTLELVRELIDFYRAAGEYEKALPLCRWALKQSEAGLSTPQQEFSEDLFNLVEIVQLQGDLAGAREQAQQTIAARKKRFGADHPATAHAWFVLGQAAMYETDVDAAAEAFDKSLEIREKRLPANHPDLAQSALRAGQVARYRQEYNRSLLILRQAWDAEANGRQQTGAVVGEIISEFAQSLTSVGVGTHFYEDSLIATNSDYDNRHSLPVMVTWSQPRFRAPGEFETAPPMLRLALESCERQLGPSHPASIEIWHCMADDFQSVKRWPDAVFCADRALEIARAHYGTEHTVYAWALFKAAVAYKDLQKYEKAEQSFQQVLQLIEKPAIQPLHKDMRFLVHIFLGQLYCDQQRWPEGLEHFDRFVREVREYLLMQIPILSEDIKPFYLQLLRTELVWPLGIAWHRRSDQAFVDRAAEWVLNYQGLNVELLADPALSLRDGNDPRARQLYERLTDHLEEMHTGVHLINAPDFSSESAALWAEKIRLYDQLGAWLRKHPREHAWLKLDDVRATLPENSVLVVLRRAEWLAYEARQMAGQRLVAFIIPPRGKGEVEMKVLGPPEQYQQELDQIDEQFDVVLKMPPNGDWKALEKDERQGASHAIMRELEPSIGSFERWLIVPDGLFWRVPWAGLRLADHSWVIEKHEVCLLNSVRPLVAPAGSVRPGPPLVVANPTLDDGGQAGQSPRQHYAPLPNSGRELTAIMSKLEQICGAKPVSLTGDKATENAIKDVHSPRFMILSTQIYFDQTALRDNALDKVGLVLMGANTFPKPYDSSLNDGILRGLEVAGLDLRGTQLVVFSAGRSGFTGDVRGEVMPGLQTAFELAGARSVLASIRLPMEQENVDLLPPFFDALAAGESKSAALRKAQLKLIETYRERNGGTHSAQWANFVLLGDPK